MRDHRSGAAQRHVHQVGAAADAGIFDDTSPDHVVDAERGPLDALVRAVQGDHDLVELDLCHQVGAQIDGQLVTWVAGAGGRRGREEHHEAERASHGPQDIGVGA